MTCQQLPRVIPSPASHPLCDASTCHYCFLAVRAAFLAARSAWQDRIAVDAIGSPYRQLSALRQRRHVIPAVRPTWSTIRMPQNRRTGTTRKGNWRATGEHQGQAQDNTSRPSTTYPLVNGTSVVSGWGDLNSRPPAPKAGALPDCATSRSLECRSRHGLHSVRKAAGVLGYCSCNSTNWGI